MIAGEAVVFACVFRQLSKRKTRAREILLDVARRVLKYASVHRAASIICYFLKINSGIQRLL